MLKAASKVSMVDMGPERISTQPGSRLGGVAAWLAGHGVSTDLETRDEATGLHAVADQRGASIDVADAYEHSRFMEWAIGGVTRTLLGHPARSAFVSH